MKIILVHIPGCNINWLGCYGNEWVRTPHLDRLASEGIVFDQHHSANPTPDAVEDAWLSGDYLIPLAPEGERQFVDRLAAISSAGVPCVRISDGVEAIEAAEGWDAINVQSGELADAMIDAIEQLAESPRWLLWLDAHRLIRPWDVFDEIFDEYERDWIPPESFEEVPDLDPNNDPDNGPIDVKNVVAREEIERSFACAVTALDLEIGAMLDELRERNLDEGITWIITSGYGTPLGEHGVIGPANASLHEEAVHVPFMIRFPDRYHAGWHTTALTQNIDVLPTLLEMFGLPTEGLHGRSLLPLARGEVKEVRDYTVFAQQVGDEIQWGMRSHFWCYQQTKSAEITTAALYEKPSDRWEVNDVRQHHLDWCDQLERMLEQFAAQSVLPGTPNWPTLPTETMEESDDETDRETGG